MAKAVKSDDITISDFELGRQVGELTSMLNEAVRRTEREDEEAAIREALQREAEAGAAKAKPKKLLPIDIAEQMMMDPAIFPKGLTTLTRKAIHDRLCKERDRQGERGWGIDTTRNAYDRLMEKRKNEKTKQ